MVHVHVRLNKRIQREEGHLLIVEDVAKVIGPSSIVEQINRIPLQKANRNMSQVIVIDILMVIGAIQKQFPEIVVQSYGDLESIVDIDKKKPSANWIFVIFAWLLLFFGSGLAVMDFHSDVGMAKVHRTLYFLLTGKSDHNPLWIQIPYSIGLGGGMILFFNRWFNRKVDQDPNPLDIEMQTYQDSINKCVIAQDQKRKQKFESKEKA